MARALLILTLLASTWVSTIPTSLGQSIEAQPNRFLHHPGDVLTVFGTAPPNSDVSIFVFNPSGDLVGISVVTAEPDGSFSILVFSFPLSTTPNFPYGVYIINLTVEGAQATTATIFFPRFDISTDKESYEPGDLVVVSGTFPPNDEVVTQILNPSGILVATGQTTANQDGNFQVSVMRFPAEPNTLFPNGVYTVRATAAAAGETLSITIVFLGPRPPSIERVPASAPILTNQFGDLISNPRAGQVIGIQSSLRNDDNIEQVFVFLVQVRDANLVVVNLGWIRNLQLDPGETIEPALSWTPETAGEYIIDIFVLQSFDQPFPLSQSHQLSINVS